MTLIVQLKELIHKPGNMKEVVLEHTLSEAIGTEVMGLPAGSTLSIPVRLESVHEGILASAEFRRFRCHSAVENERCASLSF